MPRCGIDRVPPPNTVAFENTATLGHHKCTVLIYHVWHFSSRAARRFTAKRGRTIKYIFLCVFAFAIILAIAAKATLPRHDTHGVPTLVWATGINPVREEQISLFRAWHKQTYGEDIDVRIDAFNYDRSKIVVQSVAGAGPDLFDYWAQENLERYLSSGILLDVTDYARERGFSKELVWEGVWPSFVADGRQYGFPDNVSNSLIIYHKDLFDEAGVAYPVGDWTWDEFLEVAQKLSRNRPDRLRQYGLMAVDPFTMLYQNGASVFSPEGTRCTIDSPEAREALQFYFDMRAKYRVMPTPSELASRTTAGGFGGTDANMFATKGFAMTSGGRYWYIAFVRDALDLARKNPRQAFNLGVAPLPYFTRRFVQCGARCTAVSRTSTQVEYAVRFLQFLASEPFNRQINRSFDALAPVKKYCTGPGGIAEGDAPPPGLESANDPQWVETMSYAHEQERSPFIAPHRVSALWNEARELLEADAIGPQEALERFARDVNSEIEVNVRRNPELRARYDEALKREQADQSPSEMKRAGARGA